MISLNWWQSREQTSSWWDLGWGSEVRTFYGPSVLEESNMRKNRMASLDGYACLLTKPISPQSVTSFVPSHRRVQVGKEAARWTLTIGSWTQWSGAETPRQLPGLNQVPGQWQRWRSWSKLAVKRRRHMHYNSLYSTTVSEVQSFEEAWTSRIKSEVGSVQDKGPASRGHFF